jgi:3-carboxy-cis,cis-muconate cycloisomerase
MPHKRNPVGAGLVLTAAARAAAARRQHRRRPARRNTSARWRLQAEWPTLASWVETLGSAVEAMAEVAPGLAVDTARLQANLDATHGAILAERATFLLAATMGKDKGARLVEKALGRGGDFIAKLGPLREGAADGSRFWPFGYSPAPVRGPSAGAALRPRRRRWIIRNS